MARSAADVGLLLSSMAGPDEQDPASLAPPAGPGQYPLRPRPGSRPLTGARIGVPAGTADGLPAATAVLWEAFLRDLERLGARLVPFIAPGGEPSILGAVVEIWSYHQQFGPTALPRYTPEVAALLTASRAAAQTPSSDYIDYQRARTRFATAWRDLLEGRDLAAVVKPGSTMDGATRDQATGFTLFGGSVNGDYYWADAAGLPVVTTPVGRSAATGMPFGVQIGGAHHTEARLLQIAVDYQAHHPAYAEAPPGLAK
jgi:aspartyl-tRNA(Asn)/glutamyl-tRNA(Gln) amidotransferase subunit A